MGGYVGGVGPDDLLRLRRMVAEPDDTGGYSDALLTASIERYPVPDPDDVYPDEDGWYPSYDLAMAASEIWSEKATMLAANFDFTADGATFSKSQQYEHYNQQARKWRAMRVPGNYTVMTMPPANAGTVIGNWNNPYE